MGGVFSALAARSAEPQMKYELAGKMKDLSLGDAHIVPIDDLMSRQSGKDLVCISVIVVCLSVNTRVDVCL